jgi:hypothetical protein
MAQTVKPVISSLNSKDGNAYDLPLAEKSLLQGAYLMYRKYKNQFQAIVNA